MQQDPRSPPGPASQRHKMSADDFLQALVELRSFLRVQLDNQTATAVHRDTHDDAAPLLRNLHGTVTGTWLHSCHVILPCSFAVGESLPLFRIRPRIGITGLVHGGIGAHLTGKSVQ